MTLYPGQVLQGRYTINALVHQGGMGSVFRAFDQSLGITVAIKERLPDPSATAAALAQSRLQFQREAQVLATLSHTHLPRVTNYFSLAGNEYLVMDFIEGRSLAEILQQSGAQPEAQVVAWANQLLDALGYIHSRNIIHRDVKPANIIVRPYGDVVLVDFGLVKLVDPTNPQTLSILRGMGTPEYSPLEQYAPNLGHTDARSDVYSLGATLYHALTGAPPVEVHQRMLNPSALVPPRALNPNLSPKLEWVVWKALEVYPQNRFQSVAEMQQALSTRDYAGTPVINAQVQTPYVAAEPVLRAKPNGTVLIAALVFAVGAVALLVAAAIYLAASAPSPAPGAGAPVAMASATAGAAALPGPVTAMPTTVALPTAAPSTRAAVSTLSATPTNAPTSAPTAVPSPSSVPGVPDGMVFVPAGEFWMGQADGDSLAAVDEQPGALVYSDAFYIDKYEVSNAQFKSCVDAGKCDAPSGRYSEQSPTAAYGNSQFDNFPVVFISQSNASNYCTWLGKRLPLEYEWEKAARGSQDQRVFPWGNEWNGYNANAGKSEPGPETVTAYPGGCSPYGACNLAGNVAEWVGDFYNSHWYFDRRVQGLLRNPQFWTTSPTAQFNVRGGSFKSSIADVRVSKRSQQKGDNTQMNDVGFRCAKSP